jgi:hypothetical protein
VRDAPTVAETYAVPHQALLRSGGPIREALGERYIVGMTPGWITSNADLGGNINHEPNAWVTTWRRNFIAARKAIGPLIGFAEFNLTAANSAPGRIENAIADLATCIDEVIGSSEIDST